MKLIVRNTSSDVFTYDSGAVSIAAGADTEVTSSYWFGLFADTNFIKDVRLSNLQLGDGLQFFNNPNEAESYMKTITSDIDWNNRDIDGALIFRLKAAKAGWTYGVIPVEFSTSRLQSDSSFFSSNADQSNRSGITLKVYDGTNTEITSAGISNANMASAVKTVIDFEPAYDYELIGGSLRLKAATSNDVRLWIVAVPDIAAPTGSKEMAGGVNLRYLSSGEEYAVDGRVSKYLAYDAVNHTNKLRFIFTYPAGSTDDIQVNIELYRV